MRPKKNSPVLVFIKSDKTKENMKRNILKKYTKKYTNFPGQLSGVFRIFTVRENCPNTEIFLVRILLYLVRIQENTDQMKLRIWTLFTQFLSLIFFIQRDFGFVKIVTKTFMTFLKLCKAACQKCRTKVFLHIKIAVKNFQICYNFLVRNLRFQIVTSNQPKISESNLHCVKSVRIRSFSGPYFSTFGLNMERYNVSLCIRGECGKISARKTLNKDTSHAELIRGA